MIVLQFAIQPVPVFDFFFCSILSNSTRHARFLNVFRIDDGILYVPGLLQDFFNVACSIENQEV